MMIVIFIVLMFDFEKVYWILLFVYIILLGILIIYVIERGMV